jgi:hypothetical protein
LCIELRVHCGYDPVEPHEIASSELEYAWELHGAAFYYHVRKYVYELPVDRGVDELVANMADSFLGGAPRVLLRLLGPPRGLDKASAPPNDQLIK